MAHPAGPVLCRAVDLSDMTTIAGFLGGPVALKSADAMRDIAVAVETGQSLIQMALVRHLDELSIDRYLFPDITMAIETVWIHLAVFCRKAWGENCR